jgi:RHS repeat-associated protein
VFDSSGSTVLTPGLAQRSNGVDRFLHEDWIGSTRYMTDSTGNAAPSALRYDAFGERTALAGPAYPTEFQFVGKLGYQSEYQDGSDPGLGIDYLQQRYYDPAIGRFISPDPSGLKGGVNLYAYVNNNPVNETDPQGLTAGSDGVIPAYFVQEVAKRMQQALSDPFGAKKELELLLEDFGGAKNATTDLISRSLALVNQAIQAGIRIFDQISSSPNTQRLKDGLSREMQISCQKIVDALFGGKDVMHAGNMVSNNLKNGFYELRNRDLGRVIVRYIGNNQYELVAEFEAHKRGDKAYGEMIQKILDDYMASHPQR